MVGEIRDPETARTAIQAGMTGHLIITTVHANSTAAAFSRLLELGLAAYSINAAVTAVLSQRLVRRLCPHCREPYQPLPELAARFDRLGHQPDTITLYRPIGCDQCNGTGYRGRLVISEVLLMTDAIRKLVLGHATATEIQKAAVAEGMVTMYEDGLRKSLDGRTTVEEVLRVAEDD
jgi:general secretion pathway protein E